MGLSQQALANALGISLCGEQSYERGIRKLPADVRIELAKLYNIDPLWVMGGPERAADR
ncbi:helix-turn-helix domain-containing protein [Paracoccus wurundjeri]|uniref:helix-turn-helix domain-containing protein n=1 Tax=Paracoccus onubensis TaxID=1675788 RepID=UPI00351D1108